MREENGGIVVRAAEADRPRQPFTGKISHRLVVQPQNALGVDQKTFAGIRQHHPTTRALEQWLIDDFFEALHLLTQRRLGPADPIGRTTERPHFGNDGKRTQQIDFE
jgi:hypothetical protein